MLRILHTPSRACWTVHPDTLLAPLLLLLVLLVPVDASAHRVNIFAWLEGSSIMVECGFNRSTPVREGQVTVFDAADGKKLLQGRTDAQGRFTFAVPAVVRQGHGLRIEINAGEGHVNDWGMTAAEISDAQALSRGFAQVRAAATGTGQSAPTAASSAANVPSSQHVGAHSPITAPEMQAIMAETLNTGLAPLRRELAALSSPGPTVRDIIGGFGWIMGLVGIACYFLARRKQQNP